MNMDFIIHFSVPLVIGILLWLISLCISNENSKELINNLGKEHVVLRLPRLYLWVGIVGLVFDVFIYNFSYGNDEIWILLIYVAYGLLSLHLIYKVIFWRIDVFKSERYFLYKTNFWKPRRVYYDDCVNYKLYKTYLVLKTSKGKVYIDCFTSNFEFILSMLSKYGVKEIE